MNHTRGNFRKNIRRRYLLAVNHNRLVYQSACCSWYCQSREESQQDGKIIKEICFFQLSLVFSPPELWFHALSIPQFNIEGEHQTAKTGSGQPAAKAVPPFREILIVRADSNANGTITVLSGPVRKTFLSVHGPFHYSDEIGLVVDFGTGWSSRDRFYWAAICAPPADFAKFLHSETDRIIVGQRQVGVDLSQPDTRPKFLRN